MAGHGPRIDHIIIGAKDINKAANHILQVSTVRNSCDLPNDFDSQKKNDGER